MATKLARVVGDMKEEVNNTKAYVITDNSFNVKTNNFQRQENKH